MKFIARVVVARPLVSLLVFLGLVGFSAIWGMQAFGNLQAAGYNDPKSESTAVFNELHDTFGVKNPEMVIVGDFAQDVQTPTSRAQAEALTRTIRDIPGVAKVTSYFSLGEPAALKSTDSKAAYFFVSYDKDVKVSAETTLLENTLGTEHDGVKVYYTGISAMANALNGTITKDIGLAESIAIPLSLILLLFVFGRLVHRDAVGRRDLHAHAGHLAVDPDPALLDPGVGLTARAQAEIGHALVQARRAHGFGRCGARRGLRLLAGHAADGQGFGKRGRGHAKSQTKRFSDCRRFGRTWTAAGPPCRGCADRRTRSG